MSLFSPEIGVFELQLLEKIVYHNIGKGIYVSYIFAPKTPLTAGLHMNIVKNELVLGSRPDYLKLYCYCQTNMQFPEEKTKHQSSVWIFSLYKCKI